MPILQPGKLYIPSGAPELRDSFLRTVRLSSIDSGVSDPPVQPGTHWYILGAALADAHLLQYANIAIADDDSDLLTATGQALDDKRKGLGLPIVQPSPSTGSITIAVTGGGSVTIADGTTFVFKNGLRGKVTPARMGVTNGTSVACVAIDVGSATNFPAGEKVRFTAPPLNVATEATISAGGPFSGGTDVESDERKRDRILNRLANPPAGGNWSHKIEVALNALASLQYAFVYPALGGPASELVVLIRDIDEENLDFTRELDVAATNIVRQALQAEFGAPWDLHVRSVASEATDVALITTIPQSVENGGDGTGWRNAVVWPDLAGGQTRVRISAYTGTLSLTLDATTAVPPVANTTEILWWSPGDMRFHKRLVTAQSGGTGAWSLTIDSPLVDSENNTAAVGDFISPAMVNADAYAATWRKVMRGLGPGEMTSDANRIPRALRHPKPTARWPSALTILQLQDFTAAHPEIADCNWSHRSREEPTIPSDVDQPPNVLTPNHFGIYEA